MQIPLLRHGDKRMATVATLRDPQVWLPVVAGIAASALYVALNERQGDVGSMSLTVDVAAIHWQPIGLVHEELAGLAAAVPPPPDWGRTRRELADLVALRQGLTPEDKKAIATWNEAPAPCRWNQILRQRLAFYRHKSYEPRSARAYAVVNAAIYDAVLVTWLAKEHFKRPTPTFFDPAFKSEVPQTANPGYPSEDAAMAFAAAGAIGYLFPEEQRAMEDVAADACRVRLHSGANFLSDIEAGRQVGKAVAARLIAYSRSDGADAHDPVPAKAADAGITMPAPPPRGAWRHPVPTEPLAGTWRPWLLRNGHQFRLAEPPRPGTPTLNAELTEVIDTVRLLTPAQRVIAEHWAADAPASQWSQVAVDRVITYRQSTAQASRTLAYVGALEADAAIACWDSQFAWYQPRPAMIAAPALHFQPDWIRTPAHPSYPAAHSVFAEAAATFLAAVFPGDRARIARLSREASISRLYGGVNYRSDLDAGQRLGRQVAELALARYNADGAPRRSSTARDAPGVSD